MKKAIRFGKMALILITVLALMSGCTFLTSASSADHNALENTDDTVTISKDEYARLEKYASLDELAQIVEEYYYIEPDTDAMLEGAKRGLLAGLGDPYTYYYSPEEFSKMEDDDKGEYAGIGIQISASYVTMFCTISRVFNNSPAAEAGLRKGDILVKVDDIDVNATTLNDAVDVMRGEVGKTVAVEVLRDGALLDFTIPRAVVHVNWVSSCMLANNVGYILLYEFSGDCAARFQEQLNTLTSQGARSIILDLRDNPGGWIDDAVKLADIFLPEEIVTYLKYRDGEREDYNATAGALDIPLVLMMNENSASSSEVLAGALQDYGVATVVGTQSYGKGIVQFVLPVGDDGAGLQVTAAQYYTPKGRSLHKVGITPDVVVALPEGDIGMYDLGDMNDPQLKKAWEVALSKVNGTFATPEASPQTETTAAPDAAAETGADPSASVSKEESCVFKVS